MENDNLLNTLRVVDTIDSMYARDEAAKRAAEADKRAQDEAALRQSQVELNQWHQDQGTQRKAELAKFAVDFDPTDADARAKLASWRAYTAGHLDDREFASTLGPKLQQLDALDELAFQNKDLGTGWIVEPVQDPATGAVVSRIDVPGTLSKWKAERAKIDDQEKALPPNLRVLAADLQATHKWDRKTASEAAYQTKLADDAYVEARNLGLFETMAAEARRKDPTSTETPLTIERRLRGEASWGPGQADPSNLGLPPGSPTTLNPNPTTAGGQFLLSYDKVNAQIGNRLAQARLDKQQGEVNAGLSAEAEKQAGATLDRAVKTLDLLSKVDPSDKAGRSFGELNPEFLKQTLADVAAARNAIGAANAAKLQQAANEGRKPSAVVQAETMLADHARQAADAMNTPGLPPATHRISKAAALQGKPAGTVINAGDTVTVPLSDGTFVRAVVDDK